MTFAARKYNSLTRNLILILGDQLNLDNPALEGFDAAQDYILMVEAGALAFRHPAMASWRYAYDDVSVFRPSVLV